MGWCIAGALLVLAAAGCLGGGCDYEPVLSWSSPSLAQAASASHEFEAIGFRSLLANDTEEFRLVRIFEYLAARDDGEGTSLWVTANGTGTFLATNGDPKGLRAAVVDFLTGLGMDAARADAYADQVRPGSDLAVEGPFRMDGTPSANVRPDGFWAYGFAGTHSIERAKPHYELSDEDWHLAVATDGSAAWWSAEGPERSQRPVERQVQQVLADHGLPVDMASVEFGSHVQSCP